MKVNMQAHGVWRAVETTEKNLEDKIDKIALAVIYQGIPEDIHLSLAEKRTAKKAWEATKITCQGAERVKTATIQTLKAEFEAMSMKESESLDDFYLKLSGLEEWAKRERGDDKLLLTRDEWLKRENRGGTDTSRQRPRGNFEFRGKDIVRGVRDKSKIRCFNCSSYGHFAIECQKPKCDRDTREEANIAQIPDGEPALLLAEKEEKEEIVLLIN
ncbi:uncharacterized protein LOC141690877 [Apium graveolens]|uniref:uncharacterized protein LOC141690877 n=1 Tax=Apium graveolens TaxID=4045 RepID=UPI003D7A5A64